ncbi:phosphoglycerate mutase [Exophiala viscosa]|uniref:Phosphoglycerate mutase n=1 Tax=Exophiala viscosa TaxID=2486360 RepID=A0AAN6DY06_9EURO|nr:phosphoglycerate mutase [Exophiala viscosa]KAI1624361.1 phosphoglycerate mutase [Exophiala viscosa]
MSDKDAATPRVFLIRHGETEWSRNGRYTGNKADIPLLPEGEDKIRQTASIIFGSGRLIDPDRISAIICSPRKRARQTLDILLNADFSPRDELDAMTDFTEDIAEWGYGDYEGLLTQQIRDLRKSRGLDKERAWDIWRDGCQGEGGDSPAQVGERLNRAIGRITEIHGKALKEGRRDDVIVVAHGHILRAFVKRWLGFSVDAPVRLEFMLEPGGVCGLSYSGGDVERRALLVGMRIPNPEVE